MEMKRKAGDGDDGDDHHQLTSVVVTLDNDEEEELVHFPPPSPHSAYKNDNLQRLINEATQDDDEWSTQPRYVPMLPVVPRRPVNNGRMPYKYKPGAGVSQQPRYSWSMPPRGAQQQVHHVPPTADIFSDGDDNNPFTMPTDTTCIQRKWPIAEETQREDDLELQRAIEASLRWNNDAAAYDDDDDDITSTTTASSTTTAARYDTDGDEELQRAIEASLKTVSCTTTTTTTTTTDEDEIDYSLLDPEEQEAMRQAIHQSSLETGGDGGDSVSVEHRPPLSHKTTTVSDGEYAMRMRELDALYNKMRAEAEEREQQRIIMINHSHNRADTSPFGNDAALHVILNHSTLQCIAVLYQVSRVIKERVYHVICVFPPRAILVDSTLQLRAIIQGRRDYYQHADNRVPLLLLLRIRVESVCLGVTWRGRSAPSGYELPPRDQFITETMNWSAYRDRQPPARLCDLRVRLACCQDIEIFWHGVMDILRGAYPPDTHRDNLPCITLYTNYDNLSGSNRRTIDSWLIRNTDYNKVNLVSIEDPRSVKWRQLTNEMDERRDTKSVYLDERNTNKSSPPTTGDETHTLQSLFLHDSDSVLYDTVDESGIGTDW